MEELNHDSKMKDNFNTMHDLHEDKKTSFMGSMANKLDSFIKMQKAKLAIE